MSGFRSGVWGRGAVEVALPPGALEVPEASRYEVLGLLGAGGMGLVYRARDRRLDREVALKVVAPDLDAEVARRLAREARVTASLDHPGIVAVHDGGIFEGRQFYTMRIIEGRSLSDAAAGLDLRGRLSLMPAFLAACQAVAYAHQRGIVHRDLKPEHILLGPFGSTLVLDWGLARAADEPDDGVLLGTPGFMAPEVVAGGTATPRSDVWALGAILGSLTGDAEAPIELRAIRRRCDQTDPAARYADAGELAEDLGRWLEGRRVVAHGYSAWELAARFVRAWRWPLVGVGALAVVGVGAGLVVREQRDRAVVAEAAARDTLRGVWSEHAVAAVERHAWADAEIAAVQALSLGEDLSARGVLAGADGAAGVVALGRWADPGCGLVDVTSDGRWFVCMGPDAVRFVAREGGEEIRLDAHPKAVWAVPGGVVMLEEGPEGERLVGLAPGVGAVEVRWIEVSSLAAPRAGFAPGRVAALYGGWVGLLDVRTGRPLAEAHCSESAETAVAVGESDRLTVICAVGELVEVSPGRAVRRVAIPAEHRIKGLMSMVDDPVVGLVGGTANGELVRIDRLTGRAAGRVHTGLGAVRHLRSAPGGLVVVLADRGAQVWDVGTGTVRAALPGGDAAVAGMLDDGTLYEARDGVRRWRLGGDALGRWTSAAGLSGVDISPDGRRVAVAGSEGTAVLLDIGTQEVLHLPYEGEGERVVKRVAFSPDGADVLWMGSVTPPTRLSAASGDGVRPLCLAFTPLLPCGWLRRGAWAGADRIVGFGGGEYFALFALDGTLVAYLPNSLSVRDLAGSADGRRVVWVDGEAQVWQLRDGEIGGEPQRWVAGAAAVAVSADVGVAASATEIGAYTADGAERWRAPLDEEPAALAVSADGRFVAAGAKGTGRIVVWGGDGRRLLHLPGHRGRVADLVFSPDGSALWSVGWDGELRRWDLGVIDAPTGLLRERAEARWMRAIEAD